MSSSLGQRQLRDSTADFQKQLDDRNHVAGDGSGVASHESRVTEKDESCDIHVTERSEEEITLVTLDLRLRDRTAREQFYTTNIVQVTVFYHMWPRKEGIDS